MRTIRRATCDDLADVLQLLNGAAAWLRSRGLDQWPHGFSAERMRPLVERDEVFLVHEGHRPTATVTVSPDGDPDFWTPTELAEPAHYIAKLATDRDHAGNGLGALLLRWVVDHAALHGMRWVRLDAWRTNADLHEFYRKSGWTHLRTTSLPHRKSGALFQRPALEDITARNAFKEL